MQIFNYTTPKGQNNYNSISKATFGNKYDKLIQNISTARPKHVQLREDDVVTILSREGFTVETGKGAHRIARKTGERPLTFSTTRGTKKFLDPQTIVWLKNYFANKNAALIEATK